MFELDERLKPLLEWWSDLPKDGMLPPAESIDPFVLKPWLGDLGIVEPVGTPPRFRIRLAGTNLRDIDIEDSTGRFFDEFVPAQVLDDVLRPYHLCLHKRRPVADQLRLHRRSYVVIERLLLPFGPEVQRILVAMLRPKEADAMDFAALLDDPGARLDARIL